VIGDDGTSLLLDAGTGLRRAGLVERTGRIDILLTHLHLDHIQGLGFFDPLFRPGQEIHVWGPAASDADLGERLARYFSPPLFPVRIREVEARLTVHAVGPAPFQVGGLSVRAERILHPGPTLGFRISEDGRSVVYLPDHEPALGLGRMPGPEEWTSGWSIAQGADLLVHDSQYTSDEYADRRGWGHSSIEDCVTFARAVGAARLVSFHHDPGHSDARLDRLTSQAATAAGPELPVVGGREGLDLAV
jgi:phosphoribosyl 1,2-cyclic phosphodiesterase